MKHDVKTLGTIGSDWEPFWNEVMDKGYWMYRWTNASASPIDKATKTSQ